jgi:hypothetical protein
LFLLPKRGKQVLAEGEEATAAGANMLLDKAGAFGKMKTSELSYNKMLK